MKTPPLPILFRITGSARDGKTVTLGKYRTLPEAEMDYARLIKDADYRNVTIQEIAPPPPQPAPVLPMPHVKA